MANAFDQFGSATPATPTNAFAQFGPAVSQAAPDPNDPMVQSATNKWSNAGLSLLDSAKNLPMGALRGLAGLGQAYAAPVDIVSSLIQGKSALDVIKARNQAINDFSSQNADPSSPAFKAGELVSQVAGTAGVGPLLGLGAKAVPGLVEALPSIVPALESGGFTLGKEAVPATTFGGKVANAATRAAAGAVVGGASAGLTNPGDAGTGAIIGAALPGSAQIASVIGNKAGAAAARAITEQAQNATRDATLSAGQNAGYVVPPSTINPSILNQTLESIASKAATGQAASIQNQKITNMLARSELGLPADTPLSISTLDQFRNSASAPYREVAALPAMPPQRYTGIGGYPLIGPAQQAPADALHDLQQARFDANSYWNEFRRTGEVASRDKAIAAGNSADSLESYLEQTATAAGRPDLVDSLRQARTQIAKSYAVQGALNGATGDVSAKDLATMIGRGKPLNGGLQTAGQFAEAFPKANQDVAQIGSQGVSKVAASLAAVLGGGGATAAGPVGGAIGAAIPFVAPSVAQRVALSKLYQSWAAQPNYGGMAPSLANMARRFPELVGNPVVRAIAYQPVPSDR